LNELFLGVEMHADGAWRCTLAGCRLKVADTDDAATHTRAVEIHGAYEQCQVAQHMIQVRFLLSLREAGGEGGVWRTTRRYTVGAWSCCTVALQPGLQRYARWVYTSTRGAEHLLGLRRWWALGLALPQQPRHRMLPALLGPLQRRLFSAVVRRVHVGTGGQQHPGHRRVVVLGRAVQRSAARVAAVHSRAQLEQRLRGGGVPVVGGEVQRPVGAAAAVHVGAVLHEPTHLPRVPAAGSDAQVHRRRY
jgi:hypothetical protein